jgi:Ni/Fe-hydrogenase 1 B-type cytochrome subunit
MTASQTKEIRHPLMFRILHALILISILILIATGFYMHRPFIGGGGFLMSVARGLHFFVAAVLIVSVVIRIIVMFAGSNRDWRSIIPTGSDFKLLPRALGYYAYIGKELVLKKKYNPLQMISYSLIFIMIIFQIFSGFALLYPDGWMSWFNYGLFNNEIQVRMAHYIVNWLFVLFLMIHVYLGIRETFPELKEMHLFSNEEESEGAVK